MSRAQKIEKILDLWAHPDQPSLSQIAFETRLTRDTVSSILHRARNAGDPRARYRNKEPEMDNTERKMILAISEINEATRDLAGAVLMPDTNQKVSKIAGCVAGYERASARLMEACAEIDRRMNPSKFETKPVNVVEGQADTIAGQAEAPLALSLDAAAEPKPESDPTPAEGPQSGPYPTHEAAS